MNINYISVLTDTKSVRDAQEELNSKVRNYQQQFKVRMMQMDEKIITLNERFNELDTDQAIKNVFEPL